MRPHLSRDAHPQIHKWWDTKEELPLLKSATREGVANALVSCADNKLILALTADLAESTGLSEFKKKYPKRFIDVGVAEQSLAGIAAGLASEGFRPLMTSFAVFSPGRNWDFIRVQIAMSNLPVVIVGSHAGLATGQDGATHQALEDVALMRSLEHMTIVSPSDLSESTGALVHALTKSQGPSYVRLAREKTPLLYSKYSASPRWLLKGGDTVIMTTGIMAWNALHAAKLLWYHAGIAVSVLTVPVLTPLDDKLIDEALQHKRVYTLEDHNIVGGLGSAVAESSAKIRKSKPLTMLGVKGFGETGSSQDLYKHFGLDAVSIARRIIKDVKIVKLWGFDKALREKTLKTPELIEDKKKVSVMVKKRSSSTKRSVKKAPKTVVKKSPVKKKSKKVSVKKPMVKKMVKKASAKKVAKKLVKKAPAKKSVPKKAVSKSPAKPSMSAFLNAWVKDHPQGWDHGAWLDLLSQLSNNNYTYTPEEVGAYIEKQRRKYFGW